jgi:hypothetical protein
MAPKNTRADPRVLTGRDLRGGMKPAREQETLRLQGELQPVLRDRCGALSLDRTPAVTLKFKVKHDEIASTGGGLKPNADWRDGQAWVKNHGRKWQADPSMSSQ